MNITDLPRNMQNKIQVSESGCWEWTGVRSPKGYGRVWHSGKTRFAHRVAYETFNGPVPDGLQTDHLCRNTCCCYPGHLEVVTCLENMRRRPDNNKSHCVHGHEMTPENTILQAYKHRGEYIIRQCRTCKNEWRAAAHRRSRVS